MENPIKMDDLGVPLFSETSIRFYIFLGGLLSPHVTFLYYISDGEITSVTWTFKNTISAKQRMACLDSSVQYQKPIKAGWLKKMVGF